MSVTLDSRLFQKRLQILLENFKTEDFNNADTLVIAAGSADDSAGYNKTVSLQLWLIGYELPDSIMCFTPTKITFLCSAKKCSILETLKLKSDDIEIEYLRRSKDADYNNELFDKLLKYLASNGPKLGTVIKDKFKGKFITEWIKRKESCETKFEDVDISSGLAAVFSVKDEDEQRNMKIASRLSTLVMQNYVIEEIEQILDEDKKITHEAFTEKIEGCLDESYKSKLKFPNDVALDSVDWCYPPIVQSGGKYDLRPSAVSNEDRLHAGVIICSIGIKYKGYCSNVARTFMIDPEKSKEKNYKFLCELQDYVLNLIFDGTTFKEVYSKALAYVESKRPDLKENLVKNIGFGMGLEFRESNYSISPKNTRQIKSGMILNLAIGFQNLTVENPKDSKSENYSLMVSDSVRVTGNKPVFLTEVTKDSADICYIFKEPVDEKVDDVMEIDGVKKEKKQPSAAASQHQKKNAVLASKLRGDNQDEMTNDQRRKEHQLSLAALRQQEGLNKYGDGNGDENSAAKQLVFKKFESYKKETLIPRETKDLRVIVDRRNSTIILPIYGIPVPFHINTLKNVSKTEDRDNVFLRFNFVTPGQTMGKKDANTTPFEDPNATFVRSLTFKSSDIYRFNETFKEVNDLKKEIQKRELERKEKADLVEQDKLVEIRGRRPPRLGDLYIRPALEGKRFLGELEIHSNGLRYINNVRSDQRIDILFSNIKHLFYQPCTSELIIIIHIHLHDHIMIGKKKTKDVQFYREVGDVSFDETGNKKRRYNYGDEDELDSEQNERKARNRLNKEFKEFANTISEMSKGLVEVDTPFRDLGFHGVPHRQLVLLQPTTDCLVHLTDNPFLVVTIADIEIAHLERVQFGLRNFDMVFVFKDFSKTPIHINTIPMKQLDNVKEWLDSVDVPFSEGPVNLSWGQIMKTINDDPGIFFKEGGWSFLSGESDGMSDMSESASEFDMDSSAAESASSEDSDESDFSGSGSEDGSEDMSGSGSGEDWDELEKKAGRSDQKKREKEMDSDSDDGHRKKVRR